MIQCQALPVLFDQVVFYKMADYCRPEVGDDVISGQIAFGIEVVPLTKFGDFTLSRLVTIQNAADRRTSRKKSPTNALRIASVV